MTHYSTSFEITGTGERVGPRLLEEAKELVEKELEVTGKGQHDWETEFGLNEKAGFAEITAERPHPATDEYPIRLEVRLCTRGDNLHAEVRTRFLMTSAGEPPNLRSGPPRLLQRLTEEFRCSIGREVVSYDPLMVGEGNAEEYVTDIVTSAERRLPILAISAYGEGAFAVDPVAAQGILAGVARVAAYEPDAIETLGNALKSSVFCYGGAVRMLWPGCSLDVNGDGPRIFKMADKARMEGSRLLLQVQQECVENAPESDFGRWFNEAKVKVVSDQLERLKVSRASVPTRDGRKADLTIKHLQRRNDELNEAIADLKEERDRVREEAERRHEEVVHLQQELEEPENLPEELRMLRRDSKGLKADRRELEKTNEKLNDDNQILRQKNQALERQSSGQVLLVGGKGNARTRAILLDDLELGNVSILNHATNIFRDSMRAFIVGKLERRDLREIKKDLMHVDGLNEGDPKTFKKVLDIAGGNSGYQQGYGGTSRTLNFDDVVEKFQERFPKGGILASNLREIKRGRNQAAHPPPGGLPPTLTGHRVRLIAETLDSIGDPMPAVKVRNLAALIVAAE